MNNASHFYQAAQVCKNGHLRNTDVSTHAAKNEDFCSKCGAEVISVCPHCGSPIRGAYYIRKPIYNSAMFDASEGRRKVSHIAGYKDERVSRIVDIPAYCYKCGKSFPWTEEQLKTAENIINMLDDLTDEQKKQLIDFIPDIVIETPRSKYAALVYAKFLDGIQGIVYENFRAWCHENVLPTLLVLMNMAK